ncbi:unnamed protein product, partial [Adineta steineri]
MLSKDGNDTIKDKNISIDVSDRAITLPVRNGDKNTTDRQPKRAIIKHGNIYDYDDTLNSLTIIAQDNGQEHKNLDAQGLNGVINYITELSEEWKKQKVLIALVGGSGSGKSTLINRFRSLLPDEEGAANTLGGIRECTLEIHEYPMKDTNVVYYDLPGVGTRRFPFHEKSSQAKYAEKFHLSNYDYFMIVVHGRFDEDDWNLARYISEELKRNYSFVLTHVDVIRQDMKYRKAEKIYGFAHVKDEIREDIRQVLRDANPDKIFLVSNQIIEHKESGRYMYTNDPEYEFDRLVRQIHLGMVHEKKAEAFIMSTKSISEHAIRAKADVLRGYVKYLSIVSGAAGIIPFPMVSASVDMAIIMHSAETYFNAFGLKDSHVLQNLVLEEGTFGEKLEYMLEAIKTSLGAKVAIGVAGSMLIEETLKFIPLVGSVAGVGLSYATTSHLLHSLINYFEQEALDHQISSDNQLPVFTDAWQKTLYQNTFRIDSIQSQSPSPTIERDKMNHQLTIEIFDRLLKFGNETDRPLFCQRLQFIWEEQGIFCQTHPTITNQILDLYKLHHLVQEKQGYLEITTNRGWKEISNVLGFGDSGSAAYSVKRNYVRLGLLAYECRFDRAGIDPRSVIELSEMPHTVKKRKRGNHTPSTTRTVIK